MVLSISCLQSIAREKEKIKGRVRRNGGRVREREGKKTAIIALLNFFLFIIGVANGTSKNVVLGKILAGS